VDQELEGRVVSGINNLYLVETEVGRFLCTIKGKRLGLEGRYHNPIAAGDRVRVRLTGPAVGGRGTVVALLERSTLLARWNKKTRAPQLMAANATHLVCVTSTQSPPFRPRFLDRLIIAGESGGLEPIIALNKADLGVPEEMEDRLAAYEQMGYAVAACSALNGRGIDVLVERIRGGVAVFAGQSGVGKSSLLNWLDPSLNLKIGDISSKHDRGVHTTTATRCYRLACGLEVMDTPGMRELELAGFEPAELRHYYRDFREPAARCEYDGCLHVDEASCGVRRAVGAGQVHADRYESYLRTYEQVCEAYRARVEQAS
jgi:ribosome biogenesis GTPase